MPQTRQDRNAAPSPRAGGTVRSGAVARRATMSDIADHLGVSRQLVSLVMRGADGASTETRRRVMETAAVLGYRRDALAGGLRSARTYTLGVVFSLRRPFEVELVELLLPLTSARGYHLLLGATTAQRPQDAVVDELLGYRCEGLVVVGPDPGARWAQVAREVPIVQIGRGDSTAGMDVIRNDDALGVGQAVQHLVELGHRRIAFVDGGTNPGAVERATGFRTAMAAAGLTQGAQVLEGGYSEEEGAAAAQQLLAAGHLPSAVIASNDLAAIGVLDAFVRAGVGVPGQVSVIGYDDARAARLPGIDLTSVRQDVHQMAHLAVDALTDRLADGADSPEREPLEALIAPQLVVRGTTAAAAA